MVTFILACACGVVLCLAFSGNIIAIGISVGLYYKLMQALWQSFLDSSVWVAQSIATLIYEGTRAVLQAIKAITMGFVEAITSTISSPSQLFFVSIYISLMFLRPFSSDTHAAISKVMDLETTYNIGMAFGDLFSSIF